VPPRTCGRMGSISPSPISSSPGSYPFRYVRHRAFSGSEPARQAAHAGRVEREESAQANPTGGTNRAGHGCSSRSTCHQCAQPGEDRFRPLVP
jgi:hypothetical protein